MTTPPFLNFPSSICLANITMTLDHVVGITGSPFTKEDQRFRWPGDQWSMEFSLPPINDRGVAADWQAFGLELQGIFGNFLMGDPSAAVPRGPATGAPLVNGGGQSGNTLTIDGATAGVTGWMLKGDYFQAGTGTSSRLYMMTEDIDTDGSGNAMLTFRPSLRLPPADNSAIVVLNPRGVFRLGSNSFNWTVRPGKFWIFPTFQAVEVINA